ncbi:hypothetical protein BD410DRAFT_732735 [Rickenella mellea]|uniref:Uncharacterized protein n=1 Tax=Rickenella mellea TaxID=50990 RepID=A0A4Y7PK82_9AGAM|nr:hypothetical protein BD410DRAFT_732735 [Rickenella mellea]
MASDTHSQTIDQLVSSFAVIDRRTSASCNDLNNCRTLWNIIWSCFATIIACTWVAIHPNIADDDHGLIEKTLRHVEVTSLAVLAPEAIILWAIRQLIVARKIKMSYKTTRGWTLTHGFFALMGGFLLVDKRNNPLRTLMPDEIESTSSAGDNIDFPDITEEEIQDKSKSDTLSKGLVILQTGWFVLQCVARWIQRLPVTELEVVTLAYAVLNFVTYALWWYKPRDVQRPCRVLQKSTVRSRAPAYVTQYPIPAVSARRGHGTFNQAIKIVTHVAAAVAAYTLVVLIYGVYSMIGVIMALIRLAAADEDIEYGDTRVPSFYSGPLSGNERLVSALAAGVVAAIFGAIHCIAWPFQFPTVGEQFMWRICSIAIISLPALILLLTGRWVKGQDSNHPLGLRSSFGSILVVLGLAYLGARIALIVEAFVSLRALPIEAYQTVSWTTFIPHI